MNYKSVPNGLINAFLIVLFLSLTLSCSPGSRFLEEEQIISMEKTPCYGYCPVYKLRIDQNGNGVFNGLENTDPIGRYSFRLSSQEMEMIKALFNNSGFFDLEDRYYKNVTDLPTTYIEYRSGERSKRITDYYGAPGKLKDLEDQLEKIVLSKKMKESR